MYKTEIGFKFPIFTQNVCLLITLYNVCAVPWGISRVLWGIIVSTVGVFSNVEDIMSTVGDTQYRGGIMMHKTNLFLVTSIVRTRP